MPTQYIVDDVEAPSEDALALARDFDVTAYFPFKVHGYYQAVIEAVSAVYTTRYGLSVGQWRVMANLGVKGGLSASEIVARSAMDKVMVSRAVAALRQAGLVKRDIDGDDRRRSVLRLTDKGLAIYCDLVPRVLAAEASLFEGLDDVEQATLLRLMRRVRDNAMAGAGDNVGRATSR